MILKALNVKPVNLKQKLFTKSDFIKYVWFTCNWCKSWKWKNFDVNSKVPMRLVDLDLYDKIIYVRNSIESLDKGADVGFIWKMMESRSIIWHLVILEFIAKKQLKKVKIEKIKNQLGLKLMN